MTLSAFSFSCGSREPGMAAMASRKSSINAVRMLVRPRHERRTNDTAARAPAPPPGGADSGARSCVTVQSAPSAASGTSEAERCCCTSVIR